mmetsp:Transcript_12529/g.20326  ORF Transcript_12529/g.20326 Transcript_12529/m.20326 type:complete len:278 (+) Transcript_12529:819-1652(+)
MNLDRYPWQWRAKVLDLIEKAFDEETNGGVNRLAILDIRQLHGVEEILLELIPKLGRRHNQSHIHKSSASNNRGSVVNEWHECFIDVLCLRQGEKPVDLTDETRGRRRAVSIVHIHGVGILFDLLDQFVDASDREQTFEIARAQDLILEHRTAIEGSSGIVTPSGRLLVSARAGLSTTRFRARRRSFNLLLRLIMELLHSLAKFTLGVWLLRRMQVTLRRLLFLRLVCLRLATSRRFFDRTRGTTICRGSPRWTFCISVTRFLPLCDAALDCGHLIC